MTLSVITCASWTMSAVNVPVYVFVLIGRHLVCSINNPHHPPAVFLFVNFVKIRNEPALLYSIHQNFAIFCYFYISQSESDTYKVQRKMLHQQCSNVHISYCVQQWKDCSNRQIFAEVMKEYRVAQFLIHSAYTPCPNTKGATRFFTTTFTNVHGSLWFMVTQFAGFASGGL